jgi:beta-glucanase (GH16 family)
MIGTQKGGGVGKIKPHEDDHVYAIDWTPEKIDFLFDGKIYFTFDKVASADSKKWPFDQPFHLILNLAVGGNLGGKMGVDSSAFPALFNIDYVRVYQKMD